MVRLRLPRARKHCWLSQILLGPLLFLGSFYVLPLAYGDPPKPVLNQEFTKRLILEWNKALGIYDSTQEHFRFISATPVSFHFVEPDGYMITDKTFAIYENGRFRVNQKVIEKAVEALRNQGALEEQIATILAQKTVAVIAHEIRHPMNEKELKEIGISYSPDCRENEISGFCDEIRVILECKEKNLQLWQDYTIPDLDHCYKVLEGNWKKGLQGLQEYIRRNYQCPSILSCDRQALLNEIKQDSAMLKRGLKKVQEYKAALADWKEPKEVAEAEGMLRKLPREDDFKIAIARADLFIQLLENETQFLSLQEFYRKKLQSVEQAWKRSN